MLQPLPSDPPPALSALRVLHRFQGSPSASAIGKAMATLEEEFRRLMEKVEYYQDEVGRLEISARQAARPH